MLFYVYILNSLVRKYIYVGITNNVQRRFDQHQNGKEKTTSPYKPFELALTEEYQTRIDARKREKYLKSGIGKEWIKNYILKQ